MLTPCGPPLWPLNGIEAQGNKDPNSSFSRHWITKSGGNYYDPSYGTPAIEGGDIDKKYEDSAFAGFGSRADHPSVDRQVAVARKNKIDDSSSSEVNYSVNN